MAFVAFLSDLFKFLEVSAHFRRILVVIEEIYLNSFEKGFIEKVKDVKSGFVLLLSLHQHSNGNLIDRGNYAYNISFKLTSSFQKQSSLLSILFLLDIFLHATFNFSQREQRKAKFMTYD
jgi:hypothetical protein